jgi:hypothetical protein
MVKPASAAAGIDATAQAGCLDCSFIKLSHRDRF